MFRESRPGDWALEEEEDQQPVCSPWAQAQEASSTTQNSTEVNSGDFPSLAEAVGQKPQINSGRRGQENHRHYEDSHASRERRRGHHDNSRLEGGSNRNNRNNYPNRNNDHQHHRDSRDQKQSAPRATGRWEKHNMDDYNDRMNDFSRDHHRDSRRGRGQFQQELRVEQGFIVSLKDQFGFVNSMEKEEDIFFHYSELRNDCLEQDLQIGDEMAFEVRNRGGKASATRIHKLPAGTIVTEEVDDVVLKGVVTKKIPSLSNNRRSFSSFNNRKEEVTYGLIRLFNKKEDSKDVMEKEEFIQFDKGCLKEDVSEKKCLKVGDEVSFSVSTHLKTRRRKAINVVVDLSQAQKEQQLIEAFILTATKERGVVTRNGLIKCESRPESIPYNVTSSSPKIGEEVSFFYYTPNSAIMSNKPGARAVNIEILPKGSVMFEKIICNQIQGTIIKADRVRISNNMNRRMNRRIKVTGSIEYVNAENKTCTIEFGKEEEVEEIRRNDDTEDSVDVREGDVVIFDVVELKRYDNSVVAKNVKLHILNPINREQGIISTTLDHFGFIKCCCRTCDIYFHFSEVLLFNAHSICEGQEVEFEVVDDENEKKKKRAVRIELCREKNTIQWEKQLYLSTVNGLITKLPSQKNSGSVEIKYAWKEPLIFLPVLKQLELLAFLQNVEKKKFEVMKEDMHEVKQWASAVGLEINGTTIVKTQDIMENNTTSTSDIFAVDNKTISFRWSDLEDYPRTSSIDLTVGDAVSNITLFRCKRTKQLRVDKISLKKKALPLISTKKVGKVILVLVETGLIFSEDNNQYYEFYLYPRNNNTGFNKKGNRKKHYFTEGDTVDFIEKSDLKKKNNNSRGATYSKAINVIRKKEGEREAFDEQKEREEPEEKEEKSASDIESDKETVVVEGVIEKSAYPYDSLSSTGGYRTHSTKMPSSIGYLAVNHPDYNDKKLPFFLSDLLKTNPIVRAGDKVKCRILTNKKLADCFPHRAVDISLVASCAKSGVVSQIPTNKETGIIKTDDENDVCISFRLKDVIGKKLQVGDVVDFALNEKKKKNDESTVFIATSITLVQKKEEHRPVNLGVNSILLNALRKTGGTANSKYREAKGPDGTRGFIWPEQED